MSYPWVHRRGPPADTDLDTHIRPDIHAHPEIPVDPDTQVVVQGADGFIA